MKKIYAIRDRIAQDLAGYFPLVIFRTDAQAIRYFGDSAVTEKSALGAHLSDYELILCGELADNGTIRPIEPAIVITGDALKTMMTNREEPLKNA